MKRLGPMSAVLCVLAAACGAGDGTPVPSWPYWRGPNSNGFAGDYGHRLVDDLADARLVWKSEWTPGTEGHLSGFASPVVVAGRVHIYYYLGSAGYDGEKFFHPKGVPADKVDRFFSPAADDVVLCLDAGTGRTLWKRVFADKAINCQGSGKAGGHSTPAVAYGKVFAVGTTGRVYAVDAETGEPAWQANLGPFHEKNEAAKAQQIKAKRVWYHKRRYYLPSNAPVFGGGVVAVGDHHNLIGFDAGTGQVRWTVPGCMGPTNTPLRWVHKAREYFLATVHDRTTLIDAATGEALWRADTPHTSFGTPAVTDELLLCGGNHKRGVGLGCWRIDLSGAKPLWKLPATYRGATDYATPIVYHGKVYLSCQSYGPDGKPATEKRYPWICVELATGKVLGEFQHRGGGAYGGVAGDGRLFRQKGFLADLTGQWRVLSEPNRTWDYADSTSPVYLDGRLYFRGNRAVYCYDVRKAQRDTNENGSRHP